MLALEVEWLTGVCVAARTPSDETPEWPIQPDRIFNALVATFGAHGEPPEERSALQWLESLSAPRIWAAEAKSRVCATAFVPPNDVALLPDRRRRQPRRFPTSVIASNHGGPHLRVVWENSDATPHCAALQTLARDTSYIGHSSALVRCRFLNSDTEASFLPPSEVRAAPYPGRLAELEALHRRHQDNADPNAKPQPALLAPAPERAPKQAPSSVFGRDWVVLEEVGGDRPDLRAAAPVSRAMRDALMSAVGDQIPEWLSGHMANGAPSPSAHLAIVPLANVGFAHSDGALMGLALIAPRSLEEQWRHDTPTAFEERRMLSRALARLKIADPEGDMDSIALKLGVAGVWRLRPDQQSAWQSLDPRRYCVLSSRWSTATPIALDRFPKSTGADRLGEAANIVADSCERTGLPRPCRAQAHKHAAIAGAPSAWPPGGAPSWTGWARPKAVANRPLFHATIEFREPVQGPVILGAGRFFGLGFCLPMTG
jgi:CRISPR-associated protein Csb2